MDQSKIIFMQNCLKEFNYPHIHSMDDEATLEIFSKLNRRFLVVWILKQTDEDYVEIVEKSKSDSDGLADLITSIGFCTSSEKNSFMDGKCDTDKQLGILYKMFKYLKDVNDSKKVDDVLYSTVAEIDDFVKFDDNLFPMYGPKPVLTNAEKVKKIQEFKDEIARIKNMIEEDSVAKEELNVEVMKQQVLVSMENLESNFSEFQMKGMGIINREGNFNADNFTFKEDFSNTLQSVARNCEDILEFIKNASYLVKFKENNSKLINIDDNKNNNLMLKEIANLCNDIISMKASDY